MNKMFSETAAKAPFDTGKLDRLMDEAGLDVLVATSRHNVQYLLGGYPPREAPRTVDGRISADLS